MRTNERKGKVASVSTRCEGWQLRRVEIRFAACILGLLLQFDRELLNLRERRQGTTLSAGAPGIGAATEEGGREEGDASSEARSARSWIRHEDSEATPARV